MRAHVPALDGVRGLAILLVMVLHFTSFPQMTADVLVDKVFRGVAIAGWCGVDLFFVLSGFLITGILVDAKGTDRYFTTFFARRVLRIFPLYYSFLVVAFFVVPLAVPAFATKGATQAWYWAYLSNVRVACVGWEPPLWIGHFWSLAVEEQFYLVWPLVVFALSKRSLSYLCVAILPISLALRIAWLAHGNSDAAYTLMPCRMDALATGALGAIAVRSDVPSDTLRRAARVGLAFGLVALGVVAVWRRGLHERDAIVCTVGYTLNALSFVSLIVLAVFGDATSLAGRALCHPALRFFGRYSYGLYVFQQPVAFALLRWAPVPSLPRVAGAHLPAELALQALGFGVTTACALTSWYLLEAPYLRLKRRFEYAARSPG